MSAPEPKRSGTDAEHDREAHAGTAGAGSGSAPASGGDEAFDVSFPSDAEVFAPGAPAEKPAGGAPAASARPSPTVAADDADARHSQRETLLVSRPSLPGRRHARSFGDGLLLAGRFHILRFLGEGGMGEVYEAEDRELREHVALKTVRPETAAQPRAMDEFRREVHLARKVTHPNVCRIFDVFHHREPDGDVDVTFVTMELLHGETLAKCLRREGRLAPEAVLPIARQMAAALGAAHARGVVHRDFKGANVMLVPAAEAEGGLRAVVTDFGLARGEAGGEDSFGTLHTAGRIAGTPAYMAPEQVSGGPVTPAIDVYALGIVLYEMLTGRPPFLGDSPLTTAMKRLKEPPIPPRALIPDIDRRWEAAILRCLEREPAARFATAADAVAALEGRSVPAARPWPGRFRRPSWRAGVALAAGLALLASGGAWLLSRARPAAPPGDAAGAPVARARPSVAVLGFKNLAGRADAAWLSTAFSEMLASELAAGGVLRLLPGESVARAKLELALGDAEVFAADTLQRLRRNLGSDLVVTGSYLALGEKAQGRLRLDVRVQDARAGEALDSVVENGTEAELADMVSRCGLRLRTALGVGDVEDRELAAARAAFSSNPAWARLYAEGLERLRHYDAPGARALLEQAIAADPRQPLAHSALAEAWGRLGYGENARQAAKRALDLSGSLSREERLLVDARYRAYSFDWSGAVENYRTLWGFFPDNLDYGRRLSEALTSTNRGREALTVVESLRRLPAPASDDPRIDLVEAQAADALSDHPRAARLAERAAQKGASAGASLVVAEARLLHAWALFRMGHIEEAEKRAGEARQSYAAAGDRSGAADAMMITANVLWQQQGRHEEAGRLYAEALEAYRAAGNQRGLANVLYNSAGSLYARGDLEGARRRSDEALAVYHEIADRDREATALSSLGTLHLELGQPEQARRRQLEAVELFRKIGSKGGEGYALRGLAEAYRTRGDLGDAQRVCEKALELSVASSEHAEAAVTRVQLASLQVDQGRYAEAASAARAAAEELRQAGHSEGQAQALEVLARALLRQGRVADAREAVKLAESRAAQESRGTRLPISITTARAEAAAGEREAAAERLRAALGEAQRSGRVDLQLEARLALGEIGQERLDRLAREARQRGFVLIARQAEAAATRGASAR